jgi:hypothetical protein
LDGFKKGVGRRWVAAGCTASKAFSQLGAAASGFDVMSAIVHPGGMPKHGDMQVPLPSQYP